MKETGFDPLDKELREALACDAVPSADFTDKVMARAAATPQESARPAPYKRWLMTAAACLAIAAAAVPVLQSGASNSTDGAAADAAGNETAMPYADEEIFQENTALTTTPTSDAKQREDSSDDFADAEGDAPQSAEPAVTAELEHAAALLAQRGYTLEIVAVTGTAVQVAVTEESEDAQQALYDAMCGSGFVEQDGWYTLAAEVTP